MPLVRPLMPATRGSIGGWGPRRGRAYGTSLRKLALIAEVTDSHRVIQSGRAATGAASRCRRASRLRCGRDVAAGGALFAVSIVSAILFGLSWDRVPGDEDHRHSDGSDTLAVVLLLVVPVLAATLVALLVARRLREASSSSTNEEMPGGVGLSPMTAVTSAGSREVATSSI